MPGEACLMLRLMPLEKKALPLILHCQDIRHNQLIQGSKQTRPFTRWNFYLISRENNPSLRLYKPLSNLTFSNAPICKLIVETFPRFYHPILLAIGPNCLKRAMNRLSFSGGPR